MFCKNCGAPLDSNASFCTNCGCNVVSSSPRLDCIKYYFSSKKWSTVCILLAISLGMTIYSAISTLTSQEFDVPTLIGALLPIVFLAFTVFGAYALKKNVTVKNVGYLRFYPVFMNVILYIIGVALLIFLIIFSTIDKYTEIPKEIFVTFFGTTGVIDLFELVYNILTVVFVVILIFVVLYIIALHKISGQIKAIRNQVELGVATFKKAGYIVGFYRAIATIMIIGTILAIIGFIGAPADGQNVFNASTVVSFIGNIFDIFFYFILASFISEFSKAILACPVISGGTDTNNFGGTAQQFVPQQESSSPNFSDNNQ